jgi:hypothetical protein
MQMAPRVELVTRSDGKRVARITVGIGPLSAGLIEAKCPEEATRLRARALQRRSYEFGAAVQRGRDLLLTERVDEDRKRQLTALDRDAVLGRTFRQKQRQRAIAGAETMRDKAARSNERFVEAVNKYRADHPDENNNTKAARSLLSLYGRQSGDLKKRIESLRKRIAAVK